MSLQGRLGFKNTYGIHPLFWLWIPSLWMIGQVAAEFIFPKEAVLHFRRENGVHEWIQFALLIGTLILSIKILKSMPSPKNKWLIAWFVFAAIGSFYTAFEEISWGQWIFKWATPEAFEEINQQGETNLHNTSKWLNQKPRLLLEVGIIVGGIIIPLLAMLKPKWLPKRFEIIYPPNFMIFIAVIYTMAKFSHKFSRMLFDEKVFQRSSEIEELYLYFFIFLYMIVLHRRIVKTDNA